MTLGTTSRIPCRLNPLSSFGGALGREPLGPEDVDDEAGTAPCVPARPAWALSVSRRAGSPGPDDARSAPMGDRVPVKPIPQLRACAHALVRLHAEGTQAWWACEGCGAPFSPLPSSTRDVDAPPASEYLSVSQLAERIPYSVGAIRNMMSRGVFRLGVHYTKPNGGRPVFHWSAVQDWMRSEQQRAG
jgi:hypothetical protein